MLTEKPFAGKVVSHKDRAGGLCAGSGMPAINLATSKKSKRRRASVAGVAAPVNQPKTSLGQHTMQPAKEKRERPDVLPAKKPNGIHPVQTRRGKGEASWALLNDNPKQDIETDAGWRRVRLGTSQGTGKRR